jgi:hypothetical protein
LLKWPPTVTLFLGPTRADFEASVAAAELMIDASSLTKLLDDESRRSVVSRGSSSRFFSTNPSVSYSTNPAIQIERINVIKLDLD